VWNFGVNIGGLQGNVKFWVPSENFSKTNGNYGKP
jgi:hypothetical protein